MNDEKVAQRIEEMLREAKESRYRKRHAKNQKDAAANCGCERKCGDVSTHDENTVLEGILLDDGDQSFEIRTLREEARSSRF